MSETNLTNLISAAVAAKLTPEFIEKEVNSRVEKLIVESVDRALRSYSDTGKLIEKAIEDALRVDNLDLPSYGAVVSGMLKAQIERLVSPLVAGKLAEDMEALLMLAPKTIKLSEIAEDMIKSGNHEDSWGPVITVIVEVNDYGSAWVYLDERAHYDHGQRRQADISLLVSKDGTISSATLRGLDMKSTTQLGYSYGLAQKIRAWYACGTVIELDEGNVVVSVGDY